MILYQKVIPNQLTIIIKNVDCSINLQTRRPNFTSLQCWLTRWKGDDNFKGFHALYYFIVNDSDIDTLPNLIASQDECWYIRNKVLFT